MPDTIQDSRFPLVHENIRFVPVVHRRVTFAEQVRLAVLEFRPTLIAVELPETLRPWIIRGIMRLPQVSVVQWHEEGADGDLFYLPIDPCDALIEASRLGLEHEIPLAFIDLDLPRLVEPWSYVPDDMIIDKTGLERYVNRFAPILANPVADDPLTLPHVARENHMALHLRRLRMRHERVLCVLGIGHFTRVHGMLDGPAVKIPDAVADKIIGKREHVGLAHLRKKSVREVLGEIPCMTWMFEEQREELELSGKTRFDKVTAIQSILNMANDKYEERYREKVTITQRRALLQYMRNLSMVKGRLRPDAYELVAAAKGIVDGDYGYEVYEIAHDYPLQDDESDDQSWIEIRDGRGWLEHDDAKYRMRSRWENTPAEKVNLNFRRRPTLETREQWKENWRGQDFHPGICSWPPEDEVQEHFMDYVRKRALQVLTQDKKQVQKFTTALLDGLDIRETMRNWHDGQLYVQSTPQPSGQVGAVVLIFEDERAVEDGSWRSTLLAEHQNESDISFYASPLGENAVGPRICRTEFRGILSIFPAQQIPDLWMFDLGKSFEWCSDVLLAGAILFNPHKYIAYVSPHPPRKFLQELASRNRRHIIFLPSRMFSRKQLKKIRSFHILDGHDVRRWARDYIFDD